MAEFDILKEIQKNMNFLLKKVNNGKVLMKVIDEGKLININVKKGSYSIDDEENIFDEKYKGIIIVQQGRNYIEAFIEEIKQSIWKLDNNGFIILRYVNYEESNIEDFEKSFKEELIKQKYKDIESYIVIPKEKEGRDSKEQIVILAKWREELLKKSPEYESYSNNVEMTKCSGCSKKSTSDNGCGGCNGCSGCRNK